MEQLAKNITTKHTIRTIFENRDICITEKVRLNNNGQVVDTWISVRKKDYKGKVISGKKGIYPITNYSENITKYGVTHSNKLLNFFVADNLHKNYCRQVVEAEDGIFTFGKPQLINEDNAILKCVKSVEGENIKYVNQLPYETGLVAVCFNRLGERQVFDIVQQTKTEKTPTHFPLSKDGVQVLSEKYKEEKAKESRRRGKVAKLIAEREKKEKDIQGR